MKTTLNYYYNLYPEEILKVNNNYYFFYNEEKYYILLLSRPTEDIDLLCEVNKKLQSFNKAGYLIMLDKNGKKYFKYENQIYIILKIEKEEEEDEVFDINKLIMFNNLIKTKDQNLLTKNNWKQLWSEKVDYFEYQLTVTENETIIEKSINYYIGIAENAISYVSDTLTEEKQQVSELVLSHKRIMYPILSSKIYNPLNFIFDYEVRDIAEYIKTNFFNNNLNWDEIENLILSRRYNRFSLRMLYARLLYPSYYFDVYEKYKKNDKKEKELKRIISLNEQYEELLFDIYILIKKIVPIPEVEWIMKKQFKKD